MEFHIKSGETVIATVDVPNIPLEESAIHIEREDGEPMIGLVFSRLGSVSVGHWPDGERWVEAAYIPSGVTGEEIMDRDE